MECVRLSAMVFISLIWSINEASLVLSNPKREK